MKHVDNIKWLEKKIAEKEAEGDMFSAMDYRMMLDSWKKKERPE